MNPDNKWEGKIGHKSSLTFENILDKTPAHIFVKDKDNRYVWVNQTVCNFMKCKKDDLIGKTPIELFSREFSEARRKEDREILRTGKSIKNSLMHLRIKGQKKKWYLLSKIPYRNKKGDIEGIVGISIDIDNQKRKIELALR